MADILDRDFVNSILAFGGSAMLAELIGIFRETVPGRLSKLEELAGSDPDSARRAAHSLRSSGSNIGAAGFAQLARVVEVEAAADDIPEAVSALAALYEETVAALEALAAQHAP